MIGLINIDNPCMSLFVIMVFCYVKKFWIFYTFFSWIFVFTKEPCLIYFVFFLFGVFIFYLSDFIRRKEKLDAIAIMANIGTALFAIYFILCFMAPRGDSWITDIDNMLTGERQIHVFGFTADNLKVKFQEIFLFNFNWLITAGGGGAILLCKKTRQHIRKNKIVNFLKK